MRSLIHAFLVALIPSTLVLVTPVWAQDSAGKVQGGKPAPRKGGNLLTAIGANGKEASFKKWKIVQGTRKLTIEPADKDDARPPAQDYLEFREDNSTTFKDGIVTLVPIGSLRQMDYDEAKRTVAATVVEAGGKEAVLTGTTRFVGLNKLTIDVEVEVGELSTTNLKLQGGMANAMPQIAGFRFPASQPAPKAAGPIAVITGIEKDKTVFKVHDLRALYRFKDSDRISPYLLFKKDVKIEVANIVKLRKAPAENKKQAPIDYEVTTAEGKQNLILVKDIYPDNGQAGQFLGLIGKVGPGYRLFPLHTLTEMRKDEKQ